MARTFLVKNILLVALALFAGPLYASMDLGFCPKVAEALDPNDDGYFTDGDNDKALAEAEACLVSGSKRAYTSRAYVHRRLGKLDLATASINTALASGGDIYGAQRLKCAMAVGAKQFDEAKQACSAAIAANPKKAGGYFSQAGLYQALRNYPAALASIETAAALTADDASIWTLKSLILLDMNRDSDAFTAISQALRIAPTEFEPKSTAGTALMRLNKNSEAVTMLSSAISVSKNDADRADGYWKRGRAYERLGNLTAAFADYDKSVSLSPEWAQPRWERGTIHAEQKNYDAAIADYTRAIELFPDFADAYLSRAIAYNTKGSPRTALSDLKRAIKLNPNSANAYFNLGVVNDALGNSTVIEDYTRAIELDPKMANAWNNRGFVYYNKGMKAEALADYNRAIALDNTLQPALFWRARTLVDLGRDDDAIADYTRLLQVNAGYLWAYYNRGQLLLNKGLAMHKAMPDTRGYKDENMAAAFRDYEALVERDKNHDMATIWTNWAMSGMGALRDPAEMLAKLERFWNQSPERSDKYIARAGLRVALSRNQEALADGRRALELDPNNTYAKEIVTSLSANNSKPQAPALAPSYQTSTSSWMVEESEYGLAASIEEQGQLFVYMCGYSTNCSFRLDYNQACKDNNPVSVRAYTDDGISHRISAKCNLVREENRFYIVIEDSFEMRILIGTHKSISFSVIQNAMESRTPKFNLGGAGEAISKVLKGVGK